MGQPHKNPVRSTHSSTSLYGADVDKTDGTGACKMSGRLLLLGTYDGGVMGYSVKYRTVDGSSKGGPVVTRVFARSAHVGCVRALCCNDKKLFSASADESVRVFDLETACEMGCLDPRGSSGVAAVGVAGDDQLCLLTLDDNNVLRIWRVSDWALLKRMETPSSNHLRNHKILRARALTSGGCVSLAVHPSGKMCICSDGRNGLHIWNLLDGTCSGSVYTDTACFGVHWSLCGRYFGVLTSHNVHIHAVGGGAAVSIRVNQGPKATALAVWTSFCFGPGNTLFVGDSMGSVTGFDLTPSFRTSDASPTRFASLKGCHRRRIKGITLMDVAPSFIELATCDSSGGIHLWRLAIPQEPKSNTCIVKPLTLTCLVSDFCWDPKHSGCQGEQPRCDIQVKPHKRKRVVVEAEEVSRKISVTRNGGAANGSKKSRKLGKRG